ncbi:MAG: prepilin-type N-terminal cleavage/methylation domain-containing protein [Syntrophomonadaceae bacterium]|nr:prepilin-type N-terminal cleavage/methylation domain-containing protein [Syntrophomonadaceae bacterium]
MCIAGLVRVKGAQGTQGYTLLELLAVLAITGMVIAALGGLLLNGFRTCRRVDACSEIQEAARVGLEMIARDIRSCRSLKEVRENRLIMAGPDGSRLEYHVSSQTLYRSIRGVSNPVANRVKELSFRELQPDLVEVSLITGDEEFTYPLKTRVKRMTD